MTDGRGGCCIARGGHVADYNSSKMDMIMLKFRPIAPKPAEGTAASAAADGAARHAKPAGIGGRGRRKSNSSNNNNNNKDNNNNSSNNNNNNSSSGSSHSNRRRRCNNGRKRKSSSPEDDHQKSNHQNHDETNDLDDQKADLTLLPLFPEAPDLSPTSSNNNNNNQGHNNNNTLLPMLSLNYDEAQTTNTPGFEGNYNHCHQS